MRKDVIPSLHTLLWFIASILYNCDIASPYHVLFRHIKYHLFEILFDNDDTVIGEMEGGIQLLNANPSSALMVSTKEFAGNFRCSVRNNCYILCILRIIWLSLVSEQIARPQVGIKGRSWTWFCLVFYIKFANVASINLLRDGMYYERV